MSTHDVVPPVSESIRRNREMKGWSQRELGRRAGLGERNVGHWEQGRGEPSISAAIKLAKAMDITLDQLFK